MESHTALENFIEHWRYHPGFLVDAFGNATFLASIRHDQSTDKVKHSTVVRIRQRGEEHGKVILQKNACLFSEFPHLDFFPDWHVYQFNGGDGALLINGRSDKLERPFELSILPA